MQTLAIILYIYILLNSTSGGYKRNNTISKPNIANCFFITLNGICILD